MLSIYLKKRCIKSFTELFIIFMALLYFLLFNVNTVQFNNLNTVHFTVFEEEKPLKLLEGSEKIIQMAYSKTHNKNIYLLAIL